MLIAKLRISLRDASIVYNKADDLGTASVRGTVLANGAVIRGLGTHFANTEAKTRFDTLTKESNEIRTKFAQCFLRSPIDGVYVIDKWGAARTFIDGLVISPGIDATVTEFELGGTSAGLDTDEMRAWAAKVKAQLERIPLGRGKDFDADGIGALETLAKCPVLAKVTADAILVLAGQAKVNGMTKVEMKRNIELLDVQLDQADLVIKRNIGVIA